jgi:outer membrane protein
MAAWCASDMRRRTGLAFILLLGAFASARAATDLLGEIQRALDYDASLAGAQASYQAAEQGIPKARADLLPRLDGGWGRARSRIESKDQPDITYWQNGWQLQLSQPIFNWNSWTNYRQAGLVYARAGLNYASARQDLIVHVAELYFAILAAEDELGRSQHYVDALAAHVALIEAKRSVGEATLIDLQDALASRQQGLLQSEQAQETLQLKRLELTQLTGRPADDLAHLNDQADLPGLGTESEADWAAQARTQSFKVQLAQLDREIAGLEADKVHAEHYPMVNLTGSYTPAGAASGYAQPTTTTSAMLQIVVPLYAGGGIQARERESRALERKAGDDLAAAERISERDVREAYVKLVSSQARRNRLASLRDAARTVLESTSIGYDLGSRSSTDVLRALGTSYGSESALTQVRYDSVMASLLLKAGTASLRLEDIARINALLGPKPPEARRETSAPTLKKAWRIDTPIKQTGMR